MGATGRSTARCTGRCQSSLRRPEWRIPAAAQRQRVQLPMPLPSLAQMSRRRWAVPTMAEGSGSSGSGGPNSLDFDELKDQIGKLDLDKVTEMFGGNFGPQPEFTKTRSLDEVTKELGGVMDLEAVGGVFTAKNIPKDMRLPVEPLEEVDPNTLMGETDEDERVIPDDDEETIAFMEEMSKFDPLKDTTSEERQQKGKVLMDLINSGKDFEAVLQDSLGDIDEVLLRLLDGRIAQAETDGEEKKVVDGLKMLFQRLAAEMDRREAPDELQLLDACLDIMIPEEVYAEMDTTQLEQRREEVMEVLSEAFMLPGADGQNVDIFGIASMVGPQQDLNLDAVEGRRLFGSEVTRDSFIAEVSKTIKEVEEQQREEFLALKQWSEEIPGSTEFDDDEKVRLKMEVETMSKALLTQRKVLAITKEILAMAQSIRWI